MSSFKQHHIALIPLFAILAMSPTQFQSKFHSGRSVASVKSEVKTEVKGHPRYEKLVEKVKPQDAKDPEISLELFKEKLGGLKLKLMQEKEDFKKDQSDEAIVSEQRKGLESLVAEVLLVDGSLKHLEEKKLIEEADAKVSKEVIVDTKDLIEGLLTDLDANEVLVAKAKEPKKEDKPQVAEQPKPEEPKKEEPKKEEAKKEVCEAEEKNKVLTAQVADLLKQQQQILQTVLGMAQMMVSMNQQHQQQPNPYYQNGPGWNQSPYQYNQPQAAGNWVYYPQGFQPSQQNIFQQPQPQQQQQNPQQPQPQYQAQPQYQQQQQPQQQSWGMQPDPRFSVQPNFTPGNFGQDLSGLGYNMNAMPMMSSAVRMY